MKVTVTTLSDDSVFVLDVSEELELENFKAFCEIESGVPAHEIVIAFNGLPLMDDKKSLRDHGIRDGDAVILQHMHQSGSDLNLQPFNRGRQCFLDNDLEQSRYSCIYSHCNNNSYLILVLSFTSGLYLVFIDIEAANLWFLMLKS